MGDRLKQCRLIDIPRFADERGSLSAIQFGSPIPFDPKRFFYIYGVSAGADRGSHALKFSEEFIIPMVGSFSICIDDGDSKIEYRLDRPDRGLYIPPLIWHVLSDFSPKSVCGVLASTPFDPAGYYRIYQEFLNAVGMVR